MNPLVSHWVQRLLGLGFLGAVVTLALVMIAMSTASLTQRALVYRRQHHRHAS